MNPDILSVVTHRNWIAEEFEATGYIPVKHSLGFSAPIYPEDKTIAWWMPTETAARFLRAGVPLNLSTLDAEWLTRVPRGYTKREIWIGTVEEVLKHGWKHLAYVKPAEVKISGAPAQWIEIDYFIEELLALKVPKETKIQITPEYLDINSEYRCFVNQGQITTSATYLNEGSAFGGEEFKRNLKIEESAKKFALEVVKIMGEDQPTSYTLDIGMLSNGELFVVEGNPVWASNPYDCDKIEVIKAVIEGSATGKNQKNHGKFQWALDPYLEHYALSKPLIPVDYLAIP